MAEMIKAILMKSEFSKLHRKFYLILDFPLFVLVLKNLDFFIIQISTRKNKITNKGSFKTVCSWLSKKSYI